MEGNGLAKANESDPDLVFFIECRIKIVDPFYDAFVELAREVVLGVGD